VLGPAARLLVASAAAAWKLWLVLPCFRAY
jgi:hypothetical protein